MGQSRQVLSKEWDASPCALPACHETQAVPDSTCDSTNTHGVRLSVSLYTSRMDASGRSTNEGPRDARMNSDMPARTKSSLKIWEAPHAKGVTHT